jgi:hypothetical protein
LIRDSSRNGCFSRSSRKRREENKTKKKKLVLSGYEAWVDV